MAHGITKIDKGVVKGTTWHQLEQYIQQDFPVTPEQAVSVLDYPLEKRQLYRKDASGNIVEANAWEIIRTDHDMPLAHHVGTDFTVMNNKVLFDFIQATILTEFPDITIESVGTLFGGKIAFVSLFCGDFTIKGDQSNTVNRLMYYNPLGLGKYKVCASKVRVVCNNTLRSATNEAIASGLLRLVSHTKNAEQRIKSCMTEFLALRQLFLDEQAFLNHLAEIQATKTTLETFFNLWLPKDDSKVTTHAESRRQTLINAVTSNFESDQGLTGSVARSMYSLINAVTFHYDHEEPTRGNDKASIMWDGMVGGRANKKDEALDIMRTMIGKNLIPA